MQTVIAALAIALLSGMGVGSGGLLVIYLTLVENTPQLTAQGLNLLFFLFASAASLIVHITKRKIFGGAVLVMGACGIIGSLLGSFVAAHIPADLLGKIFGAMLVISGVMSLKKNRKAKTPLANDKF